MAFTSKDIEAIRAKHAARETAKKQEDPAVNSESIEAHYCPQCGVILPEEAQPCSNCGYAEERLDSDKGKVMNVIYTMKGVQDGLEVFEDRVTITPQGIWGFLNKGIKGTKEIPFASIVAVQFKEAGAVFSGYLQFTIPGGNESRGGIFAATKDENTFMFAHATNNAQAKKIKEYIDSAIRQARTSQAIAPTKSLSDELQALAQLKEKGVLSEEEFQAVKKRVIG